MSIKNVNINGTEYDVTGVTDATLSITDSPADAAAVGTAVNGIREHTKNLFEPCNVMDAYFASGAITAHADNRLVWIPCDPNTTYTVSKRAGTRFRVGYMSVPPAVGLTPTYGKSDYTASKITVTTDANAAYLIAWVWSAPTDTAITAEQMLATVQIEKASTATAYEPPYTAIDRSLRGNVAIIQQLASGEDLNDLHNVSGVYTIAYSGTYTNAPNTKAGRRILETFSPATTTYTVQRFTNATTQEEFIRIYASDAWGTWYKLTTEDKTPEICGAFTGLISTSHSGVFTNSKYENSPKAFTEARKLGILYQDLDVVFTSDLVPIVAHSSFADNAIRISDSDTSRIYFRDHTLADLKANYVFGDANYTYTIQTLEEAYLYNRNLGCYVCIDIGGGENNPTGSRETLISYMIEKGIKCEYLVTSELDTFNIIKASAGAELFPLGVVIAATGSDSLSVATEKINAILAEVPNLKKAWCLVRRERMETGGDLVGQVTALKTAGVNIGLYSYDSTTYAGDIPSFVDLAISQYVNIGYQRYLDAIGG